MTYTIIAILVVLGISVLIGVVNAFLVKPLFMELDPSKSEEENYLHIWNPECIISSAQMILMALTFVGIIISCSRNEILNESYVWSPFYVGGLCGGVVLGSLYEHFFRDPFMRRNFPNVYKKYREKDHSFMGNGHAWSVAITFNFTIPVASLFGFIGILIAVFCH